MLSRALSVTGISEEELQALQDKTNGPPEEVQQIAVEAEPSLEFAGPSWAVAENDMHEEIKRSRRIEDAVSCLAELRHDRLDGFATGIPRTHQCSAGL